MDSNRINLRVARLLVATFLIFLGFTSIVQAQTTPNCCAPPFTANVVKPNILICLDMTGSMQFRASRTINNGRYSDAIRYYGYYDADSLYYYRSGVFHKYRGSLPPNAVFPFRGNIMNWAVMSRVDVARRALTGGKGLPVNSINKNTLQAEAENLGWSTSEFGWPCTLSYTRTGVTYRYLISKPSLKQVAIRKISGTGPDTIPQSPSNSGFVCDIDITPDTVARGVIRQIGDKDLDRDWDIDAPRFALMFFSTHYGTHLERQFFESDEDPDMEPFFTKFNQEPEGGTNTGNAIMQCNHYLRYCPPHSGTGYWSPSYTHFGAGSKQDPYYWGQGGSLVPVPCRKSFVIVIGDGEANSDYALRTDNHLPPKKYPTRDLCNYDDSLEYGDYCNTGGDTHHAADDYAYFGHIQDLRDSGSVYYLPDKQNITFYGLMTFGLGSGLFKQIAKDGGFIDKNNDDIPQPIEYDRDNNGVPDNYFEAMNGYEIEEAIKKIITDILAQVSSASGAAVVSTGTKYGGTTAQAQFYPRKTFPTGEVLDWVGTCQALWLDPFGLLREDWPQKDATLHLRNDYVITMRWTGSEVKVTRYIDVFGTGDSLVKVAEVPLDDLKPVWDAGQFLWNNYNPPTIRNLWTQINQVKTNFNLANNVVLRPHMGEGFTQGRADTIIRFIRGEDFPMLRSRTADDKVWKLGDIIHSSPSMIGAPIERYDFIYGDQSYANYYKRYTNRLQVIYVGANNGMLHAFNAGQPVKADTGLAPLRLDPTAGGLYPGCQLGEELWAYIPYNNLPHLRWLTDPGTAECHVYHVDLKPYITDVKIFDSTDAVHTKGWGTILIGGMRLGGAAIKNEIDTCRSAFFAIDITDPVNPSPLWECTHPKLKYTVCYPTVVKVKSSWFLVFGSGPMTCGGECTQYGKIFVLDLKTGVLVDSFTVPDANSYITNIFACDWGIDYNVDRIYFGDAYSVTSGNTKIWHGKLYRILTKDDSTTLNWQMDMVMDLTLPITAEGSVATDEHNRLWVYSGSGKFFSDVDEMDKTRNIYVGFRDDTTHTTYYANLLNVTNYQVDTFGVVQPGTLPFDSLISMVEKRCGWYRQFAQDGEKSLTTSLVLGGAVLFTTFCPQGDSICAYGGRGNLYALFYKTGTAYKVAFLGDTLGYNRVYLPLGAGMPSEPALYVSADQTKVFIQVGGGIVSPETGIPGMPRAGVILWKGK